MNAPSLTFARGVVDTLRAAARRAAPDEACGLLFGTDGAGGKRVTEASVAPNVAADRRRFFEIDPQHLFDAMRRARRDRVAILGCWHSHPGGPAVPSATDRAGIGDRGWHWAIVGAHRIAAFAIAGDGFVPAELVVEGGGS